MKRIISYIWPFIKVYQTEHNGTLEVVTTKGRKILESPNANYSYGSMEMIFRFALDKCNLTKINNTLILGLGGGCISYLLRDEYAYKGHLDAVEFDKDIIKIAKVEFGIDNTERCTIHYNDAFDFIQNSKQEYELIIVDLFIDCFIPSIFLSHTFCQLIQKRLSQRGTLIFNLGINEMQKKDYLKVLDFFKDQNYFTSNLYNKVAHTNTILIAEKQKNRPPQLQV